MQSESITRATHFCEVEGCWRVVTDGKYCARCSEEIAALDKVPERTSKLEIFLYATLSIAIFYDLLWETRSFWLEWVEMWFGKGM